MSNEPKKTDTPSSVAGKNWAKNFARPGTVAPSAKAGNFGSLASAFGPRRGARSSAAEAPPPPPPAPPINAVIRLFPNTGHQYFFQPFEVIPGDGGWRVPAEVSNLCMNPNEWTEAPDKPWLLFKLTCLGARNGLQLAIETNIGDKDRGFLLHSFPPEHEAELLQPVTERSNYVFQDTQTLSSAVSPIDMADLVAGLTKRSDITPATLRIGWAAAAAASTRDVHLIVDFGNSRTLALLLEEDPDAISVQLDDFKGRCFPLQFKERGAQPDAVPKAKNTILDSWVLLRKTNFEGRLPTFEKECFKSHLTGFGPWKKAIFKRSKKIRQHRFVELSPVTTSAAEENDSGSNLLYQDETSKLGGNVALSSPKRYAWSTEPRVGFWHFAVKAGEYDNITKLPEFSGPVRDFMDADGRDWLFEVKDEAGKTVPPPPALRRPDERGINARPNPRSNPTYPLADALTWMALGIIERAEQQINSEEYRKASGQLFIRRRLASVQITFPSGWTESELKTYRSKWQKAINIFALSRYPLPELTTVEQAKADAHIRASGGKIEEHRASCRPDFCAEPDEAIASQIPFIVSDIQHLGGKAEEWIKLMGKAAPDGTPADHVRVLNLDIGGGTSDVAIVDYSLGDALGVSIDSVPQLKFGSSNAGDEIVRLAIEKVLLPFWVSRAPEIAIALRAFVGINAINNGVHDVEKSRAVRLIFQPLVNYWLASLSGTYKAPGGESGHPPFHEGMWDTLGRRLEELGLSEGIFPKIGDSDEISDGEEDAETDDFDHSDDAFGSSAAAEAKGIRLSKFQSWWRWESLAALESPSGLAWSEILSNCVVEVASRLMPLVALQCAKFDVDIVVVSGKPSELPPFVEEIRKHLPVPLEAIRFAKGYPVGLWYPFQKNLEIQDAKTVTVVGATLFRAFRKGLIAGWSFTAQPLGPENVRNDWSILDTGGGSNLLGFGGNNLLFEGDNADPGADEVEKIGVLMGSHIGSRRPDATDVPPDCVYCLTWKNATRPQGRSVTHVNIRIKRVIRELDGNHSEELQLVSVRNMHDDTDISQFVHLRLKTLLTNSFWMDSPLFTING